MEPTVQTPLQTPLKVVTVGAFAKAKGFTQISPKVRINQNGYPYITFIDTANKAENVYFSKNAAKDRHEGEVISKEMLKAVSVAETTNAKGELRIKLVSSDRLELESLLED